MGKFTYDVRFLGTQVSKYVAQAASDFTKQAQVFSKAFDQGKYVGPR